MTDPMRGAHPDSAELQRIADGEDGVREEVASHVEACAECRAEIERIQRVTAALSLSSRAPASLSARIESRRAAARSSSSRAVSAAGNRARRFLLPVGLAAAAVLVLLVPRVRRDETPVASGEKGIPRLWPDIPTPIARSLFHGIMSDWSPATLDSAIVAADSDSSSTIQLRYDGSRADSSAGRALAARAVAYLTSRGAIPERIRVLRSLWELGYPAPGAAVQVLVVTTTPRLRTDSAQRQP